MPGVRFDPSKHDIIELEMVRHLRRETGRKSLFVYRHMETGNWVVACWLGAEKGNFMEVLLLRSPNDFTQENVRTIREWSHGKARTLKDWAKDQAREEQESLTKWDEDLKEATAVKKFLGKRAPGVRKDHPDWEIPVFRTAIDMRAA